MSTPRHMMAGGGLDNKCRDLADVRQPESQRLLLPLPPHHHPGKSLHPDVSPDSPLELTVNISRHSNQHSIDDILGHRPGDMDNPGTVYELLNGVNLG